MKDQIHIRDLRIRTRIGVAEWEQKADQDLMINIMLEHDQTKAAKTDDLNDTVDYKGIRDEVVAYGKGEGHALLETFAQAVAEIVLTRPTVTAVEVTVDKPGALRFAASVAVTIRREK